MKLPDRPAVVVATHPRSGTHLTIDLLRRNFSALHSKKRLLEPLDSLYVPIDIALQGSTHDQARIEKLIQRHRYPIIKSHWMSADYSNLQDPGLATWLATNATVIYVIRQPKLVIASHFLFQSMFKESISANQNWLDNAIAYWCDHVTSWTSRPDVLVINFSDVIRQPLATVDKIAKTLNIVATPKSPILPPRQRSKWLGRYYRFFSTDAPSTEILTKDQGKSFGEIFKGLDLQEFDAMTKPIIDRWFSQHSGKQ